MEINIDEIKNELQKYFKIKNFEDEHVQLSIPIIEDILKGRNKNYLVNMTSHIEKSLCYQLPGIV